MASFRKIDVDAYDEDVLQETELYDPDPREPAQILSDAKQKQLAVRSALNKYAISFPRALNVALDSTPYGPNVKEAKNLALQAVVSVLNSTNCSLMKYIYKGMGTLGWGDVSGSVLLGWHGKLTDIAGTGCIVRVMADRRTV
ncbi:actin-related protein 2/3 complex subunit 5 [Boletus coccyginus]|nr:actin-related protein 2/3 complex subunit 5 [Boletus coccyginus]